jgi:hypothetical protein
MGTADVERRAVAVSVAISSARFSLCSGDRGRLEVAAWDVFWRAITSSSCDSARGKRDEAAR